MTAHLCVACGTQFPDAAEPPPHCPICADERQFIGHNGQQWTTLEALQKAHHNRFFQEDGGVWGIVTEPKFAIGQRALIVTAGNQNILWDCVSLIDPATIALVSALGGISAIAISHPHYYSSMIEWSRAFGNAPILLHENDRQWVQRPDPAIHFWRGETHRINDSATLIRLGGHFAGYQVLHSENALFTGDLPQVCLDKRFVSFMYSYPNYLPLSEANVRRIVAALDPFEYDKLYGAWPGFVIKRDAKAAVRRSAERYIDALRAER